jgi:hypothetical protein
VLFSINLNFSTKKKTTTYCAHLIFPKIILTPPEVNLPNRKNLKVAAKAHLNEVRKKRRERHVRKKTISE